MWSVLAGTLGGKVEQAYVFDMYCQVKLFSFKTEKTRFDKGLSLLYQQVESLKSGYFWQFKRL